MLGSQALDSHVGICAVGKPWGRRVMGSNLSSLILWNLYPLSSVVLRGTGDSKIPSQVAGRFKTSSVTLLERQA